MKVTVIAPGMRVYRAAVAMVREKGLAVKENDKALQFWITVVDNDALTLLELLRHGCDLHVRGKE